MPLRRLPSLIAVMMLGSSAVLSVASAAQSAGAQSRLERAFGEAVSAAAPAAEAVCGDTARFLARVQPFGPLDLAVTKAESGEHATRLRLFFFGAMAAAAGMDQTWVVERRRCDERCADARHAGLAARVGELRALTERFRRLPRLDVVAPWPDGAYRAGPVIRDGQTARAVEASPEMGFLPWRGTALTDGGAAALRELGTSPAELDALVADLRAAGVAALARDASGAVRVVGTGGIGTLEWGVVFPAAGEAPPAPGTTAPDGRRFVAVDAIGPGAYFYLTR